MVIDPEPAPPPQPTTPSRLTQRRRRDLSGARWRNRLLAAMLALLTLYAFALAKAVVVPVLLAGLLSLLLAPAVRRLCRWYVPRPVAAFVVLGAVLGLAATGLSMLTTPAHSFLATLPEGVERIERAVKELRRPIEDVSRSASQSIDRLAELAIDAGQERPRTEPEVAPPPRLAGQLTAAVPVLLASLVVVVFLTFLLLLYGDAILRKAAAMTPRFAGRRRLVQTTRYTQHQLSTYVLTITAINAVLGLVVAGALHLLGVANPMLWGALAALLNFAPYVGPMIGLFLLTLAGFAQFDEPAQALLVPATFLVIQTLEGQLFTPLVLGRSMSLDPVMVFVALLLLGWLWGVVGLLMAVPLLTCLRICAEQVPGWAPLARLLGPAVPVSPERERSRLLKPPPRPRRRRAVASDVVVLASPQPPG
ncbi:MAG: AI-2E family transporter [Xanthomonadales bacterium]|nr:AI-2E family transporter [Xanthomonadales bacterium]